MPNAQRLLMSTCRIALWRVTRLRRPMASSSWSGSTSFHVCSGVNDRRNVEEDRTSLAPRDSQDLRTDPGEDPLKDRPTRLPLSSPQVSGRARRISLAQAVLGGALQAPPQALCG